MRLVALKPMQAIVEEVGFVFDRMQIRSSDGFLRACRGVSPDIGGPGAW
jgi:hypothetical protein